MSFALSVVVAFATGAAVLDKAYLAADRPVAGEAAISESEALCRAGCVATSHGFMGVRVAFAADVADFILAASSLQ